MKNVFLWMLSASITCSGFSNMSLVNVMNEETTSKISSELCELMEEDEDVYSVMVWLKDIDYETIESETNIITNNSWQEIEDQENAIYEAALKQDTMMTSTEITEDNIGNIFNSEVIASLSEVQMQVDEMISTERELASEAYKEQNGEVVYRQDLETDVSYISRYAPVFIADLSEEQIMQLCDDEAVEQIYYFDNSPIVSIDDEITEVETGITASSTADTSYLAYIYANVVQSAGFKGTDVKIGLLDEKMLTTSSHTELNSSNIIPVAQTGTVSSSHAQNMARIICGTYGVAPKSTVYSYGVGNSDVAAMIEGVEALIDEGVTLINFSIGLSRDDRLPSYYTFDMWVDHIAAQHSVTFVVAAGNTGKGDGQITCPAGAYNAITVANADHVNGVMDATSATDYGTGCVKPDVVAPGTNVLMYANSSTSGGTSSATACVTGAIALILQAKPSIAKSPHIIKAIFIACCDRIVGSSSLGSGYVNGQGAGVINAARALTIVSKGQYIGDYRTSNGTAQKKVSVATSSSVHTYAFVGIKMNIGYNEHEMSDIDNVDMTDLTLAIVSSSGNMIGYCGTKNSSVQLVRSSSSYSDVYFNCAFANICSRGVPYAIAWY